MKTHLLTITFAVLTLHVARADSGNDLLEKVKTKYATCSSFFCEGENTAVSNMLGKEKAYKMENKFSIRFQRPNLLRVDWVKPSHAFSAPKSGSLYTRDGKYFGVPGYSPKSEEFKTIEDGMGTYAGISSGATYMIPSLLMGKKGYFYDFTCKIGSDAKLNNRDCYTLELADQKTGNWMVFIEKDTLAILRTQQIQTIKAEEARKQMEEVTKALKDRNLPLPNPPKEDYTIETTVDYSSIIFDKVMQATEFEYR